jgi:hypothetical protein
LNLEVEASTSHKSMVDSSMVEPNSCYNCNAVYSNCLKFKDWKTCEGSGCSNWCCYQCVNPDYVFPSEYLCDNCL